MPHASPWYRYAAEAESFPLASAEAWRRAPVALSRDASFAPAGDTRALAADFTQYLRASAHGLSLEAIDALRDKVWFSPDESVVPLHVFVARVAEEYLGWEGDCVALHCPRTALDLPERAARWRWLTFRVPEDLLIASLTADHDRDYPVGGVRLMLPQLDRALNEEPVAETHMHLGGGISSAQLWSVLAATMHRPPRRGTFTALDAHSPVPFGSGEAFERALLTAMVARLTLAAYMESAGPTSHPAPLASWLISYATGFEERVGAPLPGISLAGLLWRSLQALCAGREDLDRLPVAHLRALYRAMLGHSAPRRPILPPDVVEDPLTAALRMTRARASPEGMLATQALRWLRAHASHEGAARPPTVGPTFARCFWQYQRVRGIFHRFLTQEPGTPGLDWFSRHRQRKSVFVGPVERDLFPLSLRHDAAMLRLGSFEARIAPPNTAHELRSIARSIARANLALAEPRRPEVGLVLHFIRSARQGNGLACAEPSAHNRVRFREWFHQQRRGVLALRRGFEETPELLVLLRGLDVASKELAVPTWAFAPLLREARDASRVAAAELVRRGTWGDIPPMRVTVHAGEDYRRLSEGLRRIHELVCEGVLVRGDRIGHGVALGVSPDLWSVRTRRLVQPRGEHLDDLLWELECYGHGSIPAEAARLERVRAEAVRHGRAMFGRGVDLDDLIDVRRGLHQKTTGDVLRATDDVHLTSAFRESVLWRYLTDPVVYQASVVPVEVETTDEEVRMLHAMQRHLRTLLGQLEITIESNPSSNLLIGNFLDLHEHPAFRLQPLPGQAEPLGGSVLLSLNTDDPLTFATRLADEYAHLYYAMLRADVTSSDALQWIERVRRNGWRSRFTVAESRDTAMLERIIRGPLGLGR